MPRFEIEYGIRGHLVVRDVIERETIEEAVLAAHAEWEDLVDSNDMKIVTARPFRDKHEQLPIDNLSSSCRLRDLDIAGRDPGNHDPVRP
jgi:hypothetical protein